MPEYITSGVCHSFEELENNTYECLESFDMVNVERLPHEFEPILHVVQLKVMPGERFSFEFHVLDPNGENIYSGASIDVAIPKDHDGNIFGTTFVYEGIVAQSVGRYTVAIMVDGKQIGDTPFEVAIKDLSHLPDPKPKHTDHTGHTH